MARRRALVGMVDVLVATWHQVSLGYVMLCVVSEYQRFQLGLGSAASFVQVLRPLRFVMFLPSKRRNNYRRLGDAPGYYGVLYGVPSTSFLSIFLVLPRSRWLEDSADCGTTLMKTKNGSVTLADGQPPIAVSSQHVPQFLHRLAAVVCTMGLM